MHVKVNARMYVNWDGALCLMLFLAASNPVSDLE